ncbi:hypothetical protein CC53_gp134 [Rhizobium phage vB_RleS_L338C]|uniref:hypothetical protein n=1 Tax=Rhizobium phage vB_RleS_L338C TaxID=1414737 RepID=UPI0003D8175D|nr:hypothetical protein CC53_gp134 [Rhizobium phage vB_RleS_L338C]AHC30551.1 hypothetical protein L338C_134 [Rhizobium phage vB_RleS_L338C]QNH72105.1 hypothetical protein P11VFA_015 [Rhizobium phage P11VFA]
MSKNLDKGWRCFHCDEFFEHSQAAREHFGYTEDAKPACLIANADRGLLKQLRETERELANLWVSVHNEGTEAARAMLAQDSRHYTQLIQAEESGYARALRDAAEAREFRHGQHLFNKAQELGWKQDDTEGPYEFVSRKHYEQGWEDAKKQEGGER